MDEIKKASDAVTDANARQLKESRADRRALITGITGQDGAYLAKHLLSLGYEVAGIVRRSTVANPTWRLEALGCENEVTRFHADLTDARSLDSVMLNYVPTHVFNLAAQSFVGASFVESEHTMNVTGHGAVRLFESVLQYAPGAKIYQASSSEMFGASPPPQSETTILSPCSPYGCAKVYAHQMANVMRKAYGLRIWCGILFNHESPLRGREFVTQTIAMQVAACALGGATEIRLGNLNAKRDWGYAGDYVRAMQMMLDLPEPQDFVIATGETHSVRDFVAEAIGAATRAGGSEIARRLERCTLIGDDAIVATRPYEVPALLGDATLAAQTFGWRPMTSFRELVEMMMVSAMEKVMTQNARTAGKVVREQRIEQAKETETQLH